MNEEEKDLLEKTYRLAKENSKILKSIKKRERIHTVFRVIKWVAIIALFVWSYSIVQPFLEQARDVYVNIQETTSAVKDIQDKASDLQDSAGIDNLLKLFGN